MQKPARRAGRRQECRRSRHECLRHVFGARLFGGGYVRQRQIDEPRLPGAHDMLGEIAIYRAPLQWAVWLNPTYSFKKSDWPNAERMLCRALQMNPRVTQGVRQVGWRALSRSGYDGMSLGEETGK